MIRNRNIGYQDRLRILGLTTVETRRLRSSSSSVVRSDLIQIFKTFNGFDNVYYTDFLKLCNTDLRSHEFKLYKPNIKLDIGKKIFFHQSN